MKIKLLSDDYLLIIMDYFELTQTLPLFLYAMLSATGCFLIPLYPVASTVPPKCKLPPLVSFLARRVSFLSRRVSFLSIRVSFLARVTEPFSMEYITRERSLYYLLYQRFPFALCCQIVEVEIKTESLFVFSFIVLNLQCLRTSV